MFITMTIFIENVTRTVSVFMNATLLQEGEKIKPIISMRQTSWIESRDNGCIFPA